jgi:hypothetical protein
LFTKKKKTPITTVKKLLRERHCRNLIETVEEELRTSVIKRISSTRLNHKEIER